MNFAVGIHAPQRIDPNGFVPLVLSSRSQEIPKTCTDHIPTHLDVGRSVSSALVSPSGQNVDFDQASGRLDLIPMHDRLGRFICSRNERRRCRISILLLTCDKNGSRRVTITSLKMR